MLFFFVIHQFFIIYFYHICNCVVATTIFLSLYSNDVISNVCISHSDFAVALYLSEWFRVIPFVKVLRWIAESELYSKSEFLLIEKKEKNVIQYGIWWLDDINTFNYLCDILQLFLTNSHSSCFFYVIVKLSGKLYCRAHIVLKHRVAASDFLSRATLRVSSQ